ncbi:MAG: glycosyltransferase family 4 protein [Calditrichia bacterium]
MEQKIKILFFLNTSFIGGAENNVLDLAAFMDSERYEPCIAALEPGGPLLQYAQQKNIKTFDPKLSYYFFPGYLFRITRFLIKQKFDIIFLFGLKLRLILLPLSCLIRVPVRIAAIVGIDAWKNNIHLSIERILSKFTSFWVANSYVAKKRAINQERLPTKRVFVIYQGLVLTNGKTKNGSNIRYKRSSKFKIAVLANIQPGKGHSFFIEAIYPLLQDNDDIEIEFIGKDYSNGKIEAEIANFGLQDVIKLTGYLVNARNYISKFDLMILPSFAESFPTSIIESMLEKIPVISTKVGGIPELIKHGKTGWLISPGNEEELRSAILFLKDNPSKRLELAENAYNYANQRFDIKLVAKKYELLFEKFLDI